MIIVQTNTSMKNIFFFFLILGALPSQAQQISRASISPAGDFTSNENGVFINWTFGLSFTETMQGTNAITGGFQQGALNRSAKDRSPLPSLTEEQSPETPVAKIKKEVQLSLFPNPTIDLVSIRFAVPLTAPVMAILFDSSGRQISQQELPSQSSEVQLTQVGDLPSGTYFIQLFQNQESISALSFIKN